MTFRKKTHMSYSNLISDIATSMKAKESEKVVALRSLLSALKNVCIEKGIKEPTEDVFISTVQKAIKQREDSAEMFAKGNRFELVEVEKKQISWFKNYLPTQLADEEVEKIVDETISSEQATSKKDIGKVMKVLNIRLKGVADMKKVGTLIQSKLP